MMSNFVIAEQRRNEMLIKAIDDGNKLHKRLDNIPKNTIVPMETLDDTPNKTKRRQQSDFW